MKIYVAGPLADVEKVRAVQIAVVAAGHELTLDWTRGSDASLTERYASSPDVAAKIATDDLEAVLDADAVLVVMSEHDGRGMFVELGAALTRARRGELEHLVVLGPIHHESVFYFHPAVQRLSTVGKWLVSVA